MLVKAGVGVTVMTRYRLLAGLIASLLLLGSLPLAARKPGLTGNQKALHALQRLTFGARPGDVEAVQRLGLNAWLDRQLHPERIAEPPALTTKLASLTSLTMSQEEILRAFPSPQRVLAVATGRAPLPADPKERALLESLAQRYKARIERAQQRQDEKNGAPKADAVPMAEDDPQPRLDDLLTADEKRELRRGTPAERVAWLAALPPDRRAEVLAALPQNLRRGLLATAPADLRRELLVSVAPQQVLAQELVEGKLLRAVYSERQLQEVLADFWFNHFNVFLDKGADRYLVTAYEREAIRPHVLSHFRDLLGATAQSPAMLFYLDNAQSVDPAAARRLAEQRLRRLERLPNPPEKLMQAMQRQRGLNENYARELLELHTLGVDNGYTQQDIVEVARCFTGWTIGNALQGGRAQAGTFQFNERLHDQGEKVVLGVRIPAGGGREDGLKVLDILARHPSTARFISRKLAQRFVADNPPEALVTRMAQAFQKTDGDLRAVVRAMVESPEFFAPEAQRVKIKSPVELVVSAVRVLGAEVTSAVALGNQIAQLGQPLYRKQEPTGYTNTGEQWLSSSALVARMNFALALAQNRVPGVAVDSTRFAGRGTVEVAQALLLAPASPATLTAIEKGLSSPTDSPLPAKSEALVAGLVLGSPDFQRR